MASVHPAMHGKFGSTDYYMITMKANDVANQLVIPKEMPDWEDLDLEDRFQREINYNRVRKQIAPYLANDPDRFFGALIVDVINPDHMDFEAMDNVSSKFPKLYQTASKAFGFLTLSGGEMLVPLDGQHRLAAIQFALSGKDEKQKPIQGVSPNPDLANDDVLLIMIKHEPEKGRRIFNKVNRYAKATSKSENLITADDDALAILAREISNELIGSRLVNYRSNTLSASSPHFMTLPTIYESTRFVLEEQFGKISDQVLPDAKTRDLYKQRAFDYWRQLLDGITIYQSARADTEEAGDGKRIEIRKTFLLGKPIAQLSLMIAVVRLMDSDRPDGSKFPWEEIIRRINEVDWRIDESMWQRILMNGQRIVSGRQAANFAGRFIAYYLGEMLDTVELDNLQRVYESHFSEAEQSTATLPERLFEP